MIKRIKNNFCKFCRKEVCGKYCGNCGRKILDEFNDENFINLFNYISDNSGKWLSRNFKHFLKRYPFGYYPSGTRLFRIFYLTGYLVRATEEEFGTISEINDLEIEKILNMSNLKESEKIEKVVDYIDTRRETISLGGVDKKFFIFTEIVNLFNLVVEYRFINFFKQAKKEGGKLTRNFDLEMAQDIAFGHAVWGYLYRVIENFVS